MAKRKTVATGTSRSAMETAARDSLLQEIEEEDMYTHYARYLRSYDEDVPAVSQFRFTKDGAEVLFEDGELVTMKRSDIPEAYRFALAPNDPTPPARSLPKKPRSRRRSIVRKSVPPSLDTIREDEDPIIDELDEDALMEGEVVDVDTDQEQDLLSLKEIGEVLNSSCNGPTVGGAQTAGAIRPRKTAKDSAAVESAVAAYTAKAAKVRPGPRTKPYDTPLAGLKYLHDQAEKVRKGNEKAAAAQVKAQKLAEAEARNLERQRDEIRKANERLLKRIEANDAKTSALVEKQQAIKDGLKTRENEDETLARIIREREDERLALELQREEEASAQAAARPKAPTAGRPPRAEDIGFRVPEQSQGAELFTSAQVRELLNEALDRQEATHRQAAREIQEEVQRLREATERAEQNRRELDVLEQVTIDNENPKDVRNKDGNKDVNKEVDDDAMLRRDPLKDVNLRNELLNDGNLRCAPDKDALTRSENPIPLVEKDVSKLEYRLERDKDYRYWFALFKTEMCLKKLVDIIDSSVPPWQKFTMQEMAERKAIVRGIILSHIEDVYQEQVIDLEEPIAILEKLEYLKRTEVNETSFAIREKLHALKYNIKTDNAHEFDLRFDKLIRQLEMIEGVRRVDEKEKRDLYYRAVVGSVPSIKDATYSERARGTGDGFTFEQMRIYVRQYESENKRDFQPARRNVMYAGGQLRRGGRGGRAGRGRSRILRCYECGWNRHLGRDCPTPGRERCYSCQGTGHIATNCPSKRHPNLRRDNGYTVRRGSSDKRRESKGHDRRYGPSYKDGNYRREYSNRGQYKDGYKPKDKSRSDRYTEQRSDRKPKTAVGNKDKVHKNATDRDEKPNAHLLKKGTKDEGPTSYIAAKTSPEEQLTGCFIVSNNGGKRERIDKYTKAPRGERALEQMVKGRSN